MDTRPGPSLPPVVAGRVCVRLPSRSQGLWVSALNTGEPESPGLGPDETGLVASARPMVQSLACYGSLGLGTMP